MANTFSPYRDIRKSNNVRQAIFNADTIDTINIPLP